MLNKHIVKTKWNKNNWRLKRQVERTSFRYLSNNTLWSLNCACYSRHRKQQNLKEVKSLFFGINNGGVDKQVDNGGREGWPPNEKESSGNVSWGEQPCGQPCLWHSNCWLCMMPARWRLWSWGWVTKKISEGLGSPTRSMLISASESPSSFLFKEMMEPIYDSYPGAGLLDDNNIS